MTSSDFACVFVPVVTFSFPVNHNRDLLNQVDALKIENRARESISGPYHTT
jgi:hypothetical protein